MPLYDHEDDEVEFFDDVSPLAQRREYDRIMWNARYFLKLGFDEEAVETLLEWKVDPHDAEKLLFRQGVPTTCTPQQALRILTPVLV